MNYTDCKFINGKEYRLVTVRNRTKWVSSNGDLINPSRPNQKVKQYKLNTDGYPVSGGTIPIHLYVAYGWVKGWFKSAEVNHKDFNRQNFNSDNLEWVTHKDNIMWSANNNNSYSECKRGSKNGRAKFTEREIKEIRAMYQNGMSVFDIIRQRENIFDYNELKKKSSTYYHIVNNKSWKNI